MITDTAIGKAKPSPKSQKLSVSIPCVIRWGERTTAHSIWMMRRKMMQAWADIWMD